MAAATLINIKYSFLSHPVTLQQHDPYQILSHQGTLQIVPDSDKSCF